jgi:ubiquitin-protein ligase
MRIALALLTLLVVLLPIEVSMMPSPSIHNHNAPLADASTSPLRLNETAPMVKKSKRRKTKQNPVAATTTKKETKPVKGSVQSSQESATLRRIKREWKEAVKMGIAYDWAKGKNIVDENDDKYSYVRMGPYGNNLLKWHFSVMGPPNSEFDGGIYHGRVLLPKDYPGSPPRVQVLTPSGRFIPGHDICLSASNYHPESWTPKWTILSLIDALRLHMVTQANEIGGSSATPTERRKYARASRLWAMGKISHPTMVKQGIFAWDDALDDASPELLSTNHIPPTVTDRDTAVHLLSTRTLDPINAADCLPSDRTLPVSVQMTKAALDIFRSPSRLAALILLALFLVLNIK